jgi:hypothetical protein
MMEAASSLKQFERQVMWRKRLLALQDRAALVILVGCVASAAFVLAARLKEGGRVQWAILIGILGAAVVAILSNWVTTRASEREAAFAIDDTLGLEDRVITAHEIIERGGPKRVVEMALVEDAASRVASGRASSIVPYRLKGWHALCVAAIVALVAAIMIPEKALPGGETIAAARADIQAAGEQLEQAATEAEQIAPPESETAKLAVEQADLGRSLRQSNESRAEALKRLSSLEGRIRERHGALAATRAEEIVNIAERRLRAAISAKPKPRSQPEADVKGNPLAAGESPDDKEAGADARDLNAKDSKQKARDRNKDQSGATPPGPAAARVNSNSADASASNRNAISAAAAEARGAGRQRSNANNQAADKSASAGESQPNSQGQSGQANPQNRPQEPVSSQDARAASGNNNSAAGNKQRGRTANEAGEAAEGAGARAEGDAKGESKDEQNPEGGPPAANPLGGLMADQAAKALPQMSQELLKKAEQLRAGQLSPDDIKRLAQAAEFLARDLNQIAQSKELQQALEQMARQINPEQIEQVARQLMNQEQLKRELEAAARLMMQNQQAKEVVAGIKQKVDDIAKQFRGRDGNDRPGGQRGPAGGPGRDGKGESGSGSRLQLGPTGGQKLKGQGKESNVGGSLQRGTGGEYLYLQTKAGAGAARAPYSSAYPQYRREAERSVQRSQVPPRMRSVVRSYFDAINPDASKKP